MAELQLANALSKDTTVLFWHQAIPHAVTVGCLMILQIDLVCTTKSIETKRQGHKYRGCFNFKLVELTVKPRDNQAFKQFKKICPYI